MRVSHHPHRWLLIVLFLLAFTVFSTLQAYAQQAPPFDPAAVPPPAGPPSALSGVSIYMEDCAPCHGATGQSDGRVVGDLPSPPPPFADPATIWPTSPADYFHTAKYGRLEKLMPPWGNSLTDEQIWQAISYARSLHTTPGIVSAGGDLYAQECATCHGETGAGDGPEANGDEPDLSDVAAMILVSDADLSQGWNDAHAEAGGEWIPEERQAVLDYMRTFTYVPAWVSPYQAGDGVVEGQIEQGSAGGEQPGNLPVRLFAYLDFEQVGTFDTVADDEGRFRFEELSTSGDIDYIIDAEYTDINYSSDFFKLDSEQPVQIVDITVFETGDDDSLVVIPRGNLLIDHEPGQLSIAQVLTFSNRADRTFTGKTVAGIEQPVTVSFKVPVEATDLRFADGELDGRYLRVGDTIYDTVALPPGEEMRQSFVSYVLPIEGDGVTLTQSWTYPVEDVNLLVAELPDLVVEAGGLAYDSNDIMQDVEFELWTGGGVATGDEVVVTLAGLLEEGARDPRAPAPALDPAFTETQIPAGAGLQEYAVVVIVGVLVALVLIALVIIGLRRTQVDPKEMRAQERDELIQQIAELDDQHALGEVDTEQWSSHRAHLKSRLIETYEVGT